MPRYARRTGYRRRRKFAQRRRRYRPRRRAFRKAQHRTSVSTIKETAFSDVVRVRLVYQQQFTAALGSLGEAYQEFRGSSLFDPDFTGAGTQPTGFDEWAAVYRRYRVLGSKIKVYPVVDVNGPFRMLVHAGQTSVSALGFDAISMQPDTRMSRYLSHTTGTPNSISMYRSTAAVWGVPNSAIRIEQDFSANVTSNPGYNWIWSIVAQNSNTSANGVVTFTARITYYCEFFDRQYIATS